MMFNNGLPDLSLFCCTLLLCLPHFLSTHITCIVFSSTFYALCTMSIHCTSPLLCSSATALSSFFTHESPSPTTTTPNSYNNSNNNLLFSVLCIYSFCAPCACNVRNPLHVDSVPLSSTSRVFCLIIIMTLHLLWQLRLFIFFVTVELTFSILVTGFHAHPSVNPF
jgi:hypothetical protein